MQLVHGRRHLAPVNGTHQTHVIWWLGKQGVDNYQCQVMNGKWVIDFSKLAGDPQVIADLFAIVLHVSIDPWPAQLPTLLDTPIPEEVQTGRVRPEANALAPNDPYTSILHEPVPVPRSVEHSDPDDFHSVRSEPSTYSNTDFQSVVSFFVNRPYIDINARTAFMLSLIHI